MSRVTRLAFALCVCGLATAGAASAPPDNVVLDNVVPDNVMPDAASPASAAGAFRLQMPGDFHGDEPVARDGQRWLALRVDADGRARLERARLRVSAIEDALLDAPGQTTGRRVGADGAEALAFLHGPLLRSGPVDTAQVEPLDLAGLPDARIVFAGAQYRLQTVCTGLGPAPEIPPLPATSARCRVLLRHGQEQALLMETAAVHVRSADGTAHTSLGDDASPQLLFAGDLDRDGRIDLLFDTTDHYNLQRATLFLSAPASAGPASAGPAPSGPAPSDAVAPDASGAGPGTPLLRAVAQYRTVGC